MNLNDLKSQVALGEDIRRQFKRDVTNVDGLAVEMAVWIWPVDGSCGRLGDEATRSAVSII